MLLRKKRFLRFTILIIAICCTLLPLLVLVGGSFMTQRELYNRYTKVITPYNWFDQAQNNMHFVRIGILPDHVSFEQYLFLLLKSPTYLRLFWNSLVLTVPIVLGQLSFSLFAGYGFYRVRGKLIGVFYGLYLIVILTPLQIRMGFHYILFDRLDWTEGWLPIILPAMFYPFGVVFVREGLRRLDKDYQDAARIDGAGELRILYAIVLPNLRPTIAAFLIFSFADNWSMVEQALIFIKTPHDNPLSYYLSSSLKNDYSFAATCIYLLPPLLFFLRGQYTLFPDRSVSKGT